MFSSINFNHILIFIIIITVSIYLGKLLYGNGFNRFNYNTAYFDEDTDDSDTDSDTESDSDDEQIEITNLINPIPNAILSGPINDKAEMSRNTITDVADEGTLYNSEQ